MLKPNLTKLVQVKSVNFQQHEAHFGLEMWKLPWLAQNDI